MAQAVLIACNRGSKRLGTWLRTSCIYHETSKSLVVTQSNKLISLVWLHIDAAVLGRITHQQNLPMLLIQ